MRMTQVIAAAGLGTVLALASGFDIVAKAEVVSLKAVSFAPLKTPFSFEFERFVQRVNETGAGKIQINLLGGGQQVMPEFELGKAVQTGVVDLIISPGAFYTNLLPEANAIKLSEFSPEEERANGVRAYLNQLHNEKMNTQLVATLFHCSSFHLYLNKEISKPELSGLRLRASKGAGQAVFKLLGASTLNTPPSAVYTALERGTIDGYGWPLEGVPAFGLQKVTKFRVDPGIYKTTVALLVNLDSWKKLDGAQRKTIEDAAAWAETLCTTDSPMRKRALDMQASAGIKTISFSPEDTKFFLDKASEAAWQDVINDAPKTGVKLKELLTRK